MTKLNKILLGAIINIASVGAMTAQTTVPAIISSNQVWTPAGSPYMVNHNIILNNGYTITVMPGTTIQSTGNYKLIVEGEFIASGKYDSVILIDKLNFEFNPNARGYDFTNSTGSHFNYCFFKGISTGGNITLNLKEVSLLIKNCRFLNHYYTIYGLNGNSKTVQVRILRTTFESDKNASNAGYVIYPFGSKAVLEMDECLILNQSGLWPANFTKVTRSLFYNWQSYGGIRLSNSSRTAIFKCNTFRKFKNNVFEIMGPKNTDSVNISNNTFDSADHFITYTYMYSGAQMNRPVIKDNNFLYHKNFALLFSGGAQPGKCDTLDFSENYWNTTDTTLIKGMIKDFNDDITIGIRVDYSNFLSAAEYECSEDFVSVKSLRKSNFALYPNPAGERCFLRFENAVLRTIRVYDMKGSLLMENTAGEAEVSLDLRALQNGLYIVETIENGMSVSSGKLMVQH